MAKKKKKKQRPLKDDMDRDPPDPVKRHLRGEVNFACPIPGCGRPFLEWHHFDPPWKEKHHHDPNGMIALCTRCHPRADRGVWTREELHQFKQNPVSRGIIRETFGWSERSVVYKLGDCYSVNCKRGAFGIGDIPVLWDERSPDGRLLFSADFFGKEGKSLLSMRENCLSLDSRDIWDLSLDTGSTHLKLWLANRNPGLDLQFSRVSMEKLEAKVTASSQGFKPTGLLQYVADQCVNSDGLITVVEIAKAKFFTPDGRLITISDGGIKREAGGSYIATHSYANASFGFNF